MTLLSSAPARTSVPIVAEDPGRHQFRVHRDSMTSPAIFAEEITRIHCDATGVPPSYVNVIFTDVPDGKYFVAGKPAAHSFLNAAIRAGHDVTVRQSILNNLSQMWTRLTGQPEEELLISLWENAAENAMEAGSIFPAVT